MNSRIEVQSVPHLTAQQRQFVKAVLDGKSRMEAYRSSYDTHAPSRSVSAQAYRLWKNPRIQAAIALGQKGDSAVLISCGFDVEDCLVRKHLALLQNPAVPPYVQQRMLRDLWTIVQRKRVLSQPEKTAAKQEPTLEDIESLLRENNGRPWGGEPDGTPDDDELSLDDDPLPISPATRNAVARREIPAVGKRYDNALKTVPADPPEDPFSTQPPMNRGLIRRLPNW
jgi:hypothetical protein